MKNSRLLPLLLPILLLAGCACQKVVSNQSPPAEAQARLPEPGHFQLNLKMLSTDLQREWGGLP